MNINKYPKIYRQFIVNEINKANEYGISIILENKKVVYLEGDNNGSAGYFDHISKTLKVSTKRSLDSFIGLFVHESCHMDQFIEDPISWKYITDQYQIYYNYIDGEQKYNNDILQEAVVTVLENELDCEKRSIRKIKKYELPIDIKEYKQKANCYIYSLYYYFTIRKWYDDFQNDDKWKIAPINFRKDYTKIPKNLFKIFHEHHINF